MGSRQTLARHLRNEVGSSYTVTKAQQTPLAKNRYQTMIVKTYHLQCSRKRSRNKLQMKIIMNLKLIRKMMKRRMECSHHLWRVRPGKSPELILALQTNNHITHNNQIYNLT